MTYGRLMVGCQGMPSHSDITQARSGSLIHEAFVATKKTAVKMSTRKWAKGSPRRPTRVEPTLVPHFNSIEEELQYVYGSLTPEDSLRLLYKAGVLTPKGRLSSKYNNRP